MPDLSEKYLALNLSFPNRAGKLLQVVTTQKRVIEKLLRKPGLCDDTKQLIQLAAEGYIVTIDLLNYMKETLQDVANDSEVLREGSNIREIMKVQAQELRLLS